MIKILIVDDIPEYVETIKFMLPEEYEKDEAYSIKEAKEKLQKSKYDLAIIDVRLDEKDEENKEGLLLLEWIKENYPETKVIMISAYKEFEFRIESLQKGANFFLEKPIDPEILMEAINRTFKN